MKSISAKNFRVSLQVAIVATVAVAVSFAIVALWHQWAAFIVVFYALLMLGGFLWLPKEKPLMHAAYIGFLFGLIAPLFWLFAR